MKKTCFFLFLIVIGASCRKNRTCNCTVVTDGTSTIRTQLAGIPILLPGTDTTVVQPLYTVNTKKTDYKKVNKHDMRRVCLEKSEETINSTSSNVVPGIYTITTTNEGKKTFTCKIE